MRTQNSTRASTYDTHSNRAPEGIVTKVVNDTVLKELFRHGKLGAIKVLHKEFK